VLNDEGQYQEVDGSPTFPGIPLRELEQFRQMGLAEDETTMLWRFRDWLRGLLSQRPPP